MGYSKALIVLKVKKEDYLEFKTKSKRRNKVYLYWKNIIKSMSRKLKSEVRKKPTTLEPELDQKYCFKTESASKELNDFLKTFTLEVE